MTNFTLEANGSDDIIDSRDIVERIEELEAQKAAHEEDETSGPWTDCDESELTTLQAFVEEIEQYAGDKASDGITCIEESYFETYAQELADDCGVDIKPDHNGQTPWPYRHIDWEAAAIELKHDYTPCELDGVTYWIR